MDAGNARSPAFATIRADEETARVYGASGRFVGLEDADEARRHGPHFPVIDLPAPAPGPCFDGWALKGRPA